MKQLLLLVLLLCNGAAYGQVNSDWKIPKDKENFHVFLLMGQSNSSCPIFKLETGPGAERGI